MTDPTPTQESYTLTTKMDTERSLHYRPSRFVYTTPVTFFIGGNLCAGPASFHESSRAFYFFSVKDFYAGPASFHEPSRAFRPNWRPNSTQRAEHSTTAWYYSLERSYSTTDNNLNFSVGSITPLYHAQMNFTRRPNALSKLWPPHTSLGVSYINIIYASLNR